MSSAANKRAFVVGMIQRLRRHRIAVPTTQRVVSPPKQVDVGALQPRAAVLYMQRFLKSAVSDRVLHMYRQSIMEIRNEHIVHADEWRDTLSPAVAVAVHTMKRFALGQQAALLGVMARDEDISHRLMVDASDKISNLIDHAVRRFGEQMETIVHDVKSGEIDADYGIEKARKLVESRHNLLEAIGDSIATEFHARAAQEIQEELGVEEYIWLATQDELTRPMHAALDGTRQRWDDPPVVNEAGDRMPPGLDTNFFPCRCIALPVAPRTTDDRSDSPTVDNMRIVITGGPRTGKTTTALRISKVLNIPLRHTDDLISRMPWREASAEVARWFNEPGQWLIEGVAAGRAIRKWLAQHAGKAFPAYVVRFVNPVVAQSHGQRVMHKGEQTVWNTIEKQLSDMGLIVDSTRLEGWLYDLTN